MWVWEPNLTNSMNKLTFIPLLICGLLVASAAGSYSCSKPATGKYYGESMECVALLKSTCSSSYGCGLCGAPQTSKWKRGKLVKGASVSSYTAIATFDSSASYKGHAAIYVSQDSTGLWVGAYPQTHLCTRNWRVPYTRMYGF
jgi:hypothetical protein